MGSVALRTLSARGGWIIATGDLDLLSRAPLRRALNEAATFGWDFLRVDLSAVSLIDAGTAAMLLDYQRNAAGNGCWMRLVNASGPVKRVLDLISAYEGNLR